jgi:hypothetical protein
VDTTAGDSSSADAAQQQIAQRHALFDVCLGSGLAHLIVAYVCASESDTSSSSSVNHDGKRYVLKEPVAVQQWLRRRVDGLEKTVHADVSALAHARDGLDATSAASTPTDHHHHNRMHRKGTHKTSDVESFMRELSGLRAVAMALVERLQESAHQLEANALALRSLPPSMASQRREDLLQQTELARLTNEGIQQLLELLFRAQAATLTCQCLLWFKEHHVVFDADQYHEFYYQARSARASLRQSFEGSYDVVLSSVSNSDIAFPSLLIEMVHQNASVADQLSLPPGGVSDLFSLLQAPVVPAEMVQSFAREIRLAPVESFFRVQTALLLYFALDLAYVSLTQRPSHQHHAWMGQELVDHFVDIAASFAAQLGVPDDMAATLLAIWLIENAVNIKLSSNEEVGPIYQGAVTRLLESSAMHLQHKGAGLEPELILYMVETLVHRGESSIAWKIWTAFDMNLAKLPPVATEYAVMVNLELTAWERALSLLREQRRLDLLPLVLKWLVKNNRMKELVHYATLTAQEEELFDEFMMGGRVLGEDVLLEMSIRKADLLVMYYVLRNHFDRAWAVHHEHLAQIRESTSGHTSVAHAVLHQQSFRIRTALLQTMKPEPTLQAPTYNFKRSMQVTRPVDTDVMMIGSSSNLPLLQLPEMSASEDERMSDEFTMASSMPLPLPPPAPADSTPLRRRETSVSDASPASSPAPTSFTYSPGIFSSRSSQPRSGSSSLVGEATPAATQSTSRRNVLIGSIDSSPVTASSSTGPLRRHSDDASSAKRVAQTLNFGLSPVVPHGNTSGNPTPSSEHGKASSGTFSSGSLHGRIWRSDFVFMSYAQQINHGRSCCSPFGRRSTAPSQLCRPCRQRRRPGVKVRSINPHWPWDVSY